MNNKDLFLQQCITLDVETTGLNFKTAEIIELGYILNLPGPDGTLEKVPFNKMYNSYDPVMPEVSAITNITPEMIKNCPYFEDEVSDFSKIVKAVDKDAICISHNAFYDSNVLLRYGFKSDNWLCTLRMAKKIFGDDITVTQYKLPYLRYRFNILDPAIHTINSHRADSDALVTSHLLSYFIELLEEQGTIDTGLPYRNQILEWLESPIISIMMPFGKHKGKLLTDVPLSYWNWALNNMDLLNEDADNYDADFAASVANALDR